MILVTGATGTVGSQLVATLNSGGHPVKALLGRDAKDPLDWGQGADPVLGDWGQPSSLEAAVTGVDVIYLLVPADPRMEQYEHNVIDAARNAFSRPRVVLHAAAGFDHDANASRFLRAHARG